MSSLPYITAPGNIDKALNEIKKAATPDKASQDFVKTILKIPGGSGDQMTAFLKKIGLANSDGSPSKKYLNFRNPTKSGKAIAEAVRFAYSPLYIRNEYMHELGEEELTGLVVEETGQAHDSNTVKLIVSCIKNLKKHADFEIISETINPRMPLPDKPEVDQPSPKSSQEFGLNLGYTINLNLPATTDAAVFDAIFKSLKEHLLTKEDA